jgi:uncharacterized protein YndB with AHSA1/START domain
MPTKNPTKVTAAPGTQEVIITREFEAPREKVFKAFITPELLIQWLGPRGYKMTIDHFEPRAGGSYRYVHTDGKGASYEFYGVIHEVAAPERLIQTFEFEGLPEKGHVSLDTALFESLPGGRTRVTMKSIFQSVADRDGMVRSGMEKGVSEGHERLDELLEKGI